MKYKLINSSTKEEHLCDKITIDGFDYYVSDEKPKLKDVVIKAVGNIHYINEDSKDFIEHVSKLGKKVIATNNPNIDIPKVVDEVERLADEYFKTTSFGSTNKYAAYKKFKDGYNKSQETHSFTKEDMKLFGRFCAKFVFTDENTEDKTPEELLQLWEEQKPKIIYYE